MRIGTSMAFLIGLVSIVVQGMLRVCFAEFPVDVCVGTTGTVLLAYIGKRLWQKKYYNQERYYND